MEVEIQKSDQSGSHHFEVWETPNQCVLVMILSSRRSLGGLPTDLHPKVQRFSFRSLPRGSRGRLRVLVLASQDDPAMRPSQVLHEATKETVARVNQLANIVVSTSLILLIEAHHIQEKEKGDAPARGKHTKTAPVLLFSLRQPPSQPPPTMPTLSAHVVHPGTVSHWPGARSPRGSSPPSPRPCRSCCTPRLAPRGARLAGGLFQGSRHPGTGAKAVTGAGSF